MLVEEHPVFFLERFHAMMFALTTDVFRHIGHLRLAHGECAVSVLPAKPAQTGKRLFDPRGRAAFDQLRRFADCQGRWKAEQKVNVVLDAANHRGLQPVFASDASEIRPDTFLDVGANPRFAILGAENDVAMEGCERVGHAVEGSEDRILREPKMFMRRSATRGIRSRSNRGMNPTATIGHRYAIGRRFATRSFGRSLIRATEDGGRRPAALLPASHHFRGVVVQRAFEHAGSRGDERLHSGPLVKDRHRLAQPGTGRVVQFGTKRSGGWLRNFDGDFNRANSIAQIPSPTALQI
jgi:hypothetical protein